MRWASRWAAASTAAAVLCAVTACTSSPAPPTAPPTPSAVKVTPAETQLERQTREAYEGGEKVYRAQAVELDRLAQAGGTKKPSERLRELSAGPDLSNWTGVLEGFKVLHRHTRGSTKIVYVTRINYQPSQVNLDACEDGTAIHIYDHNGKDVAQGAFGRIDVVMKRLDGRWKVWSTKFRRVASCRT